MQSIKVTLDTNVLDTGTLKEIYHAANGVPLEFANTTVSAHELEGTSIIPLNNPVLETGVYGESRWDEAVWASDDEGTLFEKLLSVVSNSSFPRPNMRQKLIRGQLHQMRDVLILLSHVREGRDILVTNEKKAFVGKDGLLRTKLEDICSTRIMNVDDFISYCKSLA